MVDVSAGTVAGTRADGTRGLNGGRGLPAVTPPVALSPAALAPTAVVPTAVAPTAVVPVAGVRRRPADFDAALIERARQRVEESVQPLRLIALELGVAKGSLSRLAIEMGWTRPAGAPRAPATGTRGSRKLAAGIGDAGAVMGRLVRATDRQLRHIEARLKRKGATIEEKDARIVGHLAGTLAVLMTLKDGGSACTPEPVDRAQLNAELVRKITRWAEGGEEPV